MISPEGVIINNKEGTTHIIRSISQKIGTNGLITDQEIQLSIKVLPIKLIPKNLLQIQDKNKNIIN